MKLSHSIDLDALRQQATTAVNRFYNAQAAVVAPVPTLHMAKVDAARGAPSEQALVALKDEACARGMSVMELCKLILSKHSAQQASLLQLEASRQQVNAKIASATTGQELTAIIQSHQ